jgi:hypothetical protein
MTSTLVPLFVKGEKGGAGPGQETSFSIFFSLAHTHTHALSLSWLDLAVAVAISKGNGVLDVLSGESRKERLNMRKKGELRVERGDRREKI